MKSKLISTQMNEMDQIYFHSHLVWNTCMGERRKGGWLLKPLTNNTTKTTNSTNTTNHQHY